MLHEWTLEFKYVVRTQLYGDSSEETGHECDSPAFLKKMVRTLNEIWQQYLVLLLKIHTSILRYCDQRLKSSSFLSVEAAFYIP